ncbi:hypothetical protein Tco_0872544 [Tanacetum coccineum]
MARQCTQPKRPRNAAWFKKKAMLVEALESCQILNEEQLAFLADPCIPDSQASQITILNIAAFKTEDLDAYDSDCDDVSNAKAVLMANLSNNGLDVISEVPHSEPYYHDMNNQSVHAMQDFEQTPVVDFIDNKITKLSTEQAFWLQILHPNNDQSDISPVKIEAPKELPKTLIDIFNVFDKDLLNEVTEVQTVFNQMEAAVQQCSVDKQCFEIHKKELFLENDRILHKIMSQDVMLCVINSTTIFGDSVNLEMQSSESCDKCSDLDAELLKKQNLCNELSKSYSQLKKHFISLDLTMKLNQEIFQKEKSCNNQNALEILEYFENNNLKAQLQAKDTTIRKLKEHIKSIRENDKEEKVKQDMDEIETINIELEHIEQAKATQPLDNALDFACKHVKRIQELLVYVRDTCPNANKPSEKLVAVTPMNKVKKVRFSEPLTSSSNIHKHVESSKTPDSNKPILPSTGLKSYTSASRS